LAYNGEFGMMKNNKSRNSKSENSGKSQSISHEMCGSDLLFDNLIWMTVKDAATYLRRTENAVRLLLYKGILNTYKLGGRVYVKKTQINDLLEKSILRGGVYGS